MRKKAHVLVALLSLLLIGIILVSCPSPTSSKPEKINYTVTFDAGAGLPVPVVQTVQSGQSAVRPDVDPVNGDLHFGGWYTAGGTLYDFTTPVTANIVLTARWQYVVTFNAGAGSFTSGDPVSQVLYADAGTSITAPSVSRTESGTIWNLAGWTLEPESITPELFYLQGGTTANISLTAVWTQSFVVSFNTAGATSSTSYPNQILARDAQVTIPSQNPLKTGYLFRFWTRNGTDEYDFTAGVTENFELTAVYGVNISSVTVSQTAKTIAVNLSYGATLPELNEINIFISVNGSEPAPLSVTYQSYDAALRRMTYSYSSLVQSSFIANLSVVVSARSVVATKNATAIPIPRLQEVSGFAAVASEQRVKLNWTYNASAYSAYRITYTDHLGAVQEISPISRYTTTTTVNDLQNEHEYTFTIYAMDYNETETLGSSVTATPQIVKQVSEWLFIQYMDGDNDLNDYLWVDINEMESGLYYKPVGITAKVVVLWDGWAGDATETPQFGSSATRILELGNDTSSTANTTLSANTKDLSYTAPWLASGEVDMSNRETLKNFLAWVQERYEAEHVVLGFSNHGGGPRSALRTVTYPDGRTASLPSGRAMCWDDSAGGDTFLSTRDVATALAASGYGVSNKLGMILLDVCLGGSVEEAYEYRDYAEYFVASPNNIPGYGLNYYDVIRQLNYFDTIATVGKRMVVDYAADYQMPDAEWSSVLTQYAPYEFTSDDVDLYYAGSTLSLVDLSAMDALRTAVDSLATVLLGAGGDVAYTGLVDGEGNPVAMNYREAMKELLMRYYRAMNYMGTYTWLYDLGFVASGMDHYSAATIESKANPNAWAALNTAATNVQTALAGAVDYAWRDGYYGYPVYSNISGTTPGIPFGLTISGETFAYEGNGGSASIVDGTFPDFYTTDNLAFAASSWTQLLDVWF